MSESPSSSHESRTGQQRRVVVSGEGVDGILVACALDGAGHDVRLAGDTTAAPAACVDGVVVGPELVRFLERQGLDEADALTTAAGQYRYLAGDGTVEAAVNIDQHVTAADTLAARLRDDLPDECVQDGPAIDLRAYAGEPGRPHRAGPTTSETRSTQDAPYDLHVAADGWLSETRQHLLPEVTPEYAGYVAWQGTISEAAVPDDLVTQFEDAITVSRGRHDLLVAVVLPSPTGDGRPEAARRLAWVWYAPVGPRELGTVLTDRHGTNHDRAVPPGDLQERFTAALHDRAGEHAPAITRLVRATPDPGVEPIVDLTTPEAVIGRTALVGDAAYTARQHTATGTAKAASDAMALVDALDRYDDIDAALADWSHTQALRGRQLVEQGRQTDLDRLIGEV